VTWTSIPLKNGRVDRPKADETSVQGAVSELPAAKRAKPARQAAPRAFDLEEDAEPLDPAKQAALEAELSDLRARYGGLEGAELLEPLMRTHFRGDMTMVSSFGSESVVLLHLIAQVDPSLPVIFLNTGKLFPETLRYRDKLQEQLGLTDIRAIAPHPEDLGAQDPEGTLWGSDPDACCHIRKVLPLRRALKPFRAQITGRKRFQTKSRAGMDPIELSGGMFKINPLASWGLDDLTAYIEKHDLPRHPLVKDGFLSIGCMPCTERVKAGEDYRSGRWAGQDKDECGIHTFTDGDGI